MNPTPWIIEEAGKEDVLIYGHTHLYTGNERPIMPDSKYYFKNVWPEMTPYLCSSNTRNKQMT